MAPVATICWHEVCWGGHAGESKGSGGRIRKRSRVDDDLRLLRAHACRALPHWLRRADRLLAAARGQDERVLALALARLVVLLREACAVRRRRHHL